MAERESKPEAPKGNCTFLRLSEEESEKVRSGCNHVFGNNHRCKTDAVGYATPKNLSPLKLVLDSTEGFIPLWAKNTTLRWRFQSQSLSGFADPQAVMAAIRELLGNALITWGSAVPVKFSEREDVWDFEISVRNADDCDISGCVLASAFFPDSGRHELVIYPEMFEQPPNEQIETLAHELGHVFGLRHFFAKVSETAWPSEIFGADKPFSIMNYGAQSVLTENDKSDLKRLYTTAWSGELTHINGTPIRFVLPFHSN